MSAKQRKKMMQLISENMYFIKYSDMNLH